MHSLNMVYRMAIELELNQLPPSSCEEREALNRTRTWLICFCADGSHAIQFGKMPMIRLDDYLARNSQNWYKSSVLNMPSDVYLCAYVQLLIHVAKWRVGISPSSPGHEDEVRATYADGFGDLMIPSSPGILWNLHSRQRKLSLVN